MTPLGTPSGKDPRPREDSEPVVVEGLPLFPHPSSDPETGATTSTDLPVGGGPWSVPRPSIPHCRVWTNKRTVYDVLWTVAVGSLSLPLWARPNFYSRVSPSFQIGPPTTVGESAY